MLIWQFLIRTESILTLSPVIMQSAIPIGRRDIVKRLVVSPDHVVGTGDLLVVTE